MRANVTKEEWDRYQEQELARFEPLFVRLGITPDMKQPHVGGERYLMSGKKLVLTGTQSADGRRVVMKISSDPEGRGEIRYEQAAHNLLQTLAFANDTLLSPDELFFEDAEHGTILVTAFIEQPSVFFARPLQEQFFLALRVLEAQEGFHAVTYEHEKQVQKTFPVLRSSKYIGEFGEFSDAIEGNQPDNAQLHALLKQSLAFLYENMDTIDRYAPHLTHTDLAPHNMRVSGRGIFLLDYASFHFGNKYEGWARFLNYMLIHNPELEKLLADYVRTNRGADEYLSLRLMRVYKIGFLLDYYARSLAHTTGDLHSLTEARIAFWTGALEAILADKSLARSLVDAYTQTRNTLRTKEETARQKEFNLV